MNSVVSVLVATVARVGDIAIGVFLGLLAFQLWTAMLRVLRGK